MKVLFKITNSLLELVTQDLVRRHDFAAERVGFLSCRVAKLKPAGLIILAHDYNPVADNDYLDDPRVGAMMGPAAIRKALQFAYDHETAMFHVHMHEHSGIPHPSKTDLEETEKFVPDFWNVRPRMPHGAIIVSRDAMSGRCWYPGRRSPIDITEVRIVGPQLRFIRSSDGKSLR
jgi:hypothetical protein